MKHNSDVRQGEGHALIQLLDSNGNEITRREGRNTVTQRGRAMLARRIWSSSNTSSGPRRVRYMHLGKGNTAASSIQTCLYKTLVTAGCNGKGRCTCTITQVGGATGRTAKWQHTWSAKEFSATGIVEVVLFNSPTTNGTAFARFVFTTVNKAKTDYAIAA